MLKYHLQKPPPQLQHRTQKCLVTRWAAPSPLPRSELVSSLNGTCGERSVGPVLFPALSEWKRDQRLPSCPWEVPSFLPPFAKGLGPLVLVICGHSSEAQPHGLLPFSVSRPREQQAPLKLRDADKFLPLLRPTPALIKTGR